jgi:protocatechuate 3,4-dioxygenase beta subunit
MTRAAFVGMCIAMALQAQPPRDTRPPTSNAPAGTATIEGTVLSDEAQPKKLRRALVSLGGPALPAVRMEITDNEGHFRFTGLTAAQYALVAAKEGYAPRAYGSSRPVFTGRGAAPGPPNLSIREGESRSITMRLPRGAVIAGSVTDADGQPVPGSLVVVLNDRFDPVTGTRHLRAMDFSVADDRGVYRSFGLPAGQYVVYAQLSNFPSDVQEIKRTSSAARTLVPASIYYPSAPDGDRATRITVAAGEERAGIDIQVQYVPTATIRGFVSGGTGRPGGLVTLSRPNDPLAVSVFVGSASIAPDGQFTFTNVAPGRYQVRTQAAASPSASSGSADRQWMWGSADIAVDGEDVTNVGIHLVPTFTISGRIVFEGTTPAPAFPAMPLPASIFASTPSGVPPPAMQLLDGGKFSITGLTPGVYRPNPIGGPLRGLQTPIGPWWLKSIAVDGRELLDAPLELRQGSENGLVTFSDQASEVTGSVKDGSGAPVARGYVVIFSADRAHWFVNSRRVVAVAPDARGRYSIRNLPPGDYRAAVALDLDQGEWFDPDLLQSLLPGATPLTISGIEVKPLDLLLR